MIQNHDIMSEGACGGVALTDVPRAESVAPVELAVGDADRSGIGGNLGASGCIVAFVPEDLAGEDDVFGLWGVEVDVSARCV